MTSNDLWTWGIALYGAVVATIAVGWQIYTWLHAGPRLYVTTTPNMMSVGGSAGEQGKKVILTEVVNRGDRPTTITNLCMEGHPLLWASICRKGQPPTFYVIKEPSTTQVIPYKLEPGDRWLGAADQTAAIIKMTREGRVFFVLYHSHADKGIKVRIKGKLLD
jgi:hypothetical protein